MVAPEESIDELEEGADNRGIVKRTGYPIIELAFVGIILLAILVGVILTCT
jgi:hypothetical protein